MENKQPDDVVVSTLKKKYFELLPKERYPHTPELTQEADNLEQAIRELARTPAKPSPQ